MGRFVLLLLALFLFFLYFACVCLFCIALRWVAGQILRLNGKAIVTLLFLFWFLLAS